MGLVVASLSALCAYKPTGVDCQTHMAKGVCALQPSAAGGGGGGGPTVGAMGFLQVTDQVIKQSVIISTDVFAHIDTENTE